MSTNPPNPINSIGFGDMDVTKPYEFIRFGAMDGTKPYEFIEFVLGGFIARARGLQPSPMNRNHMPKEPLGPFSLSNAVKNPAVLKVKITINLK